MTTPEQQALHPTVTTPEELLETAPQVPYEKTSRVPEGWENLLAGAVHGLAGKLTDVDGEITDRNLTLHMARQWNTSDDPDEAIIPAWRLALFSIAAAESAEPAYWAVVEEDFAAGDVNVDWTGRHEADGRDFYASEEALIVAQYR